jgi:hypothetical protein
VLDVRSARDAFPVSHRSPDEVEARAKGEAPRPRSGRSYDEYIEAATTDEIRTFWIEGKEIADRSRIGTPGALLAHYTSASSGLDCILRSRRVRLSAFALMSDPRENKDWVRYAVNRRGGTAGSLEDMERAMAEPFPVDLTEATRQANEMRQRGTKILALTAEPSERSALEDFERAYARPRMWERYGDGHRGVCLVFDRDELCRVCIPQLQALGTLWHGDVLYDNAALVDGGTQGYRLDGSAIAAAGGGDVAQGLTAHLEQHHELLFFTKMEDYRDEQEFRYVVFDGSDADYVYIDIEDALIAVVLGEAFPEWGRDGAAAMCAEHGVAVRAMDWRDILPRSLPLDVASGGEQ